MSTTTNNIELPLPPNNVEECMAMEKAYLKSRKEFDANPEVVDMLSRARVVEPTRETEVIAALWRTHADFHDRKDNFHSAVLRFADADSRPLWTSSGYPLCFHRHYDGMLMMAARDIIPDTGLFYIYIGPVGEPAYSYDDEHCCHPQMVYVWKAKERKRHRAPEKRHRSGAPAARPPSSPPSENP